MTDKYHSDTQEKIEILTYGPYLPTTGDKEAGTHTIVPTARPAIASAQYSHSLTLPKPDDARLVVKRIASRLNVNIAGLGTATHVYCSVRVDVDDADHELFNEDWTSIGDKLDAVDTHATNKAVIFNLLKDGAAHTFYFLFWADVASQATIDLVQLWEGVGSSIVGAGTTVLAFDLGGLAAIFAQATIGGTGSSDIRLSSAGTGGFGNFVSGTTTAITPCLVMKNVDLTLNPNTAGSIAVLDRMYVNLRSEQ